MLDKGIIERVVIDYKDIHKDAVENGMKTPLDIPYFEGDFWPNILEDCIKECEQEEAKRRKEEEEALAAANDDYSAVDDTYDDGSSKDGMASQNGKKKAINNQQKKKNMKSKLSQRKSVKKLGSSSDLMTKILGNMENGIECCGNSNFIKAQFVRKDGEQRDHVQPEGGHPLRPGRRRVHLPEPDRYRGI